MAEINQDDLAKALKGLQEKTRSLGSTFADTAPRIENVADKMGILGSALSYLGQTQKTLNVFSKVGMTFGNDIGQMNSALSGAGLTAEQFQRIVSKNAQSMSVYGDLIDAGAQSFLTWQRNFLYKGGDVNNGLSDIALKAMNLGLNFDDLASSAQTYDFLTRFNTNKTKILERDRNAAILEFTRKLSDASKLTGKSTDELATDMQSLAKEGDIRAYARTLPQNIAGLQESFISQMTLMKAQNPVIAEFGRQLMQTGTVNTEFASLISQLPETRKAFLEADKLYKAGRKEEAEAMMQRAQVNAAIEVQNSKLFDTLAQRKGILPDEFTSMAAKVMGVDNAEVIRSVRDELAKSLGRMPSTDEIIAGMNKRLQASKDAAGAGDDKTLQSDGAKLTEALNQTRGVLQGEVIKFHEKMTAVYKDIGAQAGKLVSTIQPVISTGTDLIYSGIESAVGNLKTFTGLTGDKLAESLEAVRNVQERLQSLGGQANADLANEIGVLRQKIQNTDPSNQVELENLRQQLVNKLLEAQNKMTNSMGSATVNASGPTTIGVTGPATLNLDPAVLERIRNDAAAGKASGSLGTVGRLFENFGKETATYLHGIESVTTPEQMRAIVGNASLGTADAIAASMMGAINNSNTAMTGTLNSAGSMFTNVQTNIAGLLNTISTKVSTSSYGQIPVVDTTKMETELATLGTKIKGPLEEALNSSLRPLVQELVNQTIASNTITSEMSGKLNGLSGDMLRNI